MLTCAINDDVIHTKRAAAAVAVESYSLRSTFDCAKAMFAHPDLPPVPDVSSSTSTTPTPSTSKSKSSPDASTPDCGDNDDSGETKSLGNSGSRSNVSGGSGRRSGSRGGGDINRDRQGGEAQDPQNKKGLQPECTSAAASSVTPALHAASGSAAGVPDTFAPRRLFGWCPQLGVISKQEPSIYLPRVFENIDAPTLKTLLEDTGIFGNSDIADIKLLSVTDPGVGGFVRAVVHFRTWDTANPAVSALRSSLLVGKEVTVVYDDPWFFLIKRKIRYGMVVALALASLLSFPSFLPSFFLFNHRCGQALTNLFVCALHGILVHVFLQV